MKINEIKSKPQKITFPNGTQNTVIFTFQTHRIENDENAIELSKILAEGVDIAFATQAKDCSYAITRKAIPTKVALV